MAPPLPSYQPIPSWPQQVVETFWPGTVVQPATPVPSPLQVAYGTPPGFETTPAPAGTTVLLGAPGERCEYQESPGVSQVISSTAIIEMQQVAPEVVTYPGTGGGLTAQAR